MTLLLDSGDLRTVDLGTASAIRFSDPKLQAQFREYLAAVASARSKEKRSVYIDSTDSKQRDVRASYMVPTPVWKSSYRLMCAAGQPILEGWAIVDNTSSEDWNKVVLSLVSGRPISFVSQLYAPKYVTRPEAELADDHAARPVVHAAALPGPPSNGSGLPGGGIAPGSGGGFGSGVYPMSGPPGPPPAKKAEVEPSTIEATAAAEELGELFEYRIAQPVTIRKNESALLPFLQQAISARKLLIYSDHSSLHPTNAAELTNNTGKTLDGGPITVYDAGAYGGEALVETVKTGDKRLISYAVDLGTTVTDAFNSRADTVREFHAVRGAITTKTASEETRTYTIRNVDQKAKTLILEHRLRPGYTLLNRKPTGKTPNAYRFEIALAAGATQEFAVSEERVYELTNSVTSLNPDILVSYIQNRALSDSGRRQLQRIADQKSQIADTAASINDTQGQIRDLINDESRIRENVQSLNSVSGRQQLVQTYARQLDSYEQQVVALRDKDAELQKKKTALEEELNRLIESLSF